MHKLFVLESQVHVGGMQKPLGMGIRYVLFTQTHLNWASYVKDIGS